MHLTSVLAFANSTSVASKRFFKIDDSSFKWSILFGACDSWTFNESHESFDSAIRFQQKRCRPLQGLNYPLVY